MTSRLQRAILVFVAVIILGCSIGLFGIQKAIKLTLCATVVFVVKATMDWRNNEYLDIKALIKEEAA